MSGVRDENQSWRNRMRHRIRLMPALNSRNRKSGVELVVCGLSALLFTGCCGLKPATVVVVPEAIFRTETVLTNRIHLPLNPQDREKLTRFLGAGGDWSNTGGSPDLTTTRQAEPVLDFLASNPLTLAELKAGHYAVLNQYFGKKLSRQIVDARNYDPRHFLSQDGERVFAPLPAALRHARFWWLFYPDDNGNLASLMVISVIERAKPKD